MNKSAFSYDRSTVRLSLTALSSALTTLACCHAANAQHAAHAHASPAPAHGVAVAAGHGANESVSADEAKQRLIAGNRRFLAGASERRPAILAEVRHALASGQKPFAIFLACADSRVPPEILFDAHPGELFVVRVAGNVVDTDTLASVQYAVAHLGAREIIVMGHSACGAVRAAMSPASARAGEPQPVQDLLGHILPALAAMTPTADPAAAEREAIRANIHFQAEALRHDPVIAGGEKAASPVRVEEAVYDLANGKVQFGPF